MIKDKNNAKVVSDMVIRVSQDLNSSLIEMSDKLSDEEIKNYKLAVGKVLGHILIDIMNPLYDEHPELKPKGLK